MFLMNPHRPDGLPIIHTTGCARSRRAKLTKVAPEVVSTVVALWRLGVPFHQRPILCENCKPWTQLETA